MFRFLQQRRAESPMEHIAQGKRSDTLGFPHSRVSAPCKGKSFNPLCCYSCLIADLAVLKWNTVCIFCSILAPCLKAFALTGRDYSNMRYPGCRFACPGLCVPLGFQPAFAKSETSGLQSFVRLFLFRLQRQDECRKWTILINVEERRPQGKKISYFCNL